ncbi:family 78 glycoside hydrolase catalytic domain [Paenibacillus tritici]|uniref:alpha-L-rhamnosidase n=1 Tax=Paenibacillus tritici TaxID=1873425 RepID=A0ABX2DTU7_9BACL|nr:alpha-L-rhamnosidase [Paenibacillus tritici]NQX47992.1 family 78 glycoside hydrolase catalytic domain [Paenibacillus tritici]
MKIIRMKTNHVVNPLGFLLNNPRISYVVSETEAKKQVAARIKVALDEAFSTVIYDSGKSIDIDNLAFEIPIELKPRTRYYWKVEVWADNGDYAVSEAAWFETAKRDEPWTGKWIVPEMDKDIHPVLHHHFNLHSEVKAARAYVCGLGLYEMEINGLKAGDEYFTPHFNAYQKWLQYQTYDITELLTQGENRLSVCLGNGLYKGRFGFEGYTSELYGSEFALICEIAVTYNDGTTVVISSDNNWTAAPGKIREGNLYDGEVYDATFNSTEKFNVREAELGFERLTERLSLPVVLKEEIKPVEVIRTPSGETVLDMGQNMVGWLQFRTKAPHGTVIRLQYGEVMQKGEFYRDNLRTAKAEYVYTADGSQAVVRPVFTFFGFRYVKVEGWPGEINIDDFTGCVVYSDLESTGHFETSDPLVNRLFLNALWGQKGNFLDVPTDCPQRDERMGWTGDAQVFSGAACFNMDSYAFFSKYGYDMAMEQKDRGGMVPMVVPATNVQGGGSSAWADAATIIPWNVYLHYGDKAILEQQFESMKSWVDFIIRADEESGARRLWTTGFHFGDWLALDGPDPESPMGGTDTEFIASAYYRYSSLIVAKAATVLGKTELYKYYEGISEAVKKAMEDEFFSKNGRLAIDTQTAYAVALYMDIVPQKYKARVTDSFRKRLKTDGKHLRTGFVGTPYLTNALSANGSNDLAYTLLLNDDFPSWLYAVKLGATTIWERWNSIMADGTISSTGMNSLNHYAYGAIAEWMYRTVAGINPLEESPGFRQALLAPQPDNRLKWAKACVQTAAGTYRSEWSFDNTGNLYFVFEIPFNSIAQVRLPRADISLLTINNMSLETSGITGTQQGDEAYLDLESGHYMIHYTPTKSYITALSTHTPLIELLYHTEAKTLIANLLPHGMELDPSILQGSIGEASLRDLSAYYPMKAEMLDDLDAKLAELSKANN